MSEDNVMDRVRGFVERLRPYIGDADADYLLRVNDAGLVRQRDDDYILQSPCSMMSVVRPGYVDVADALGLGTEGYPSENPRVRAVVNRFERLLHTLPDSWDVDPEEWRLSHV